MVVSLKSRLECKKEEEEGDSVFFQAVIGRPVEHCGLESGNRTPYRDASLIRKCPPT